MSGPRFAGAALASVLLFAVSPAAAGRAAASPAASAASAGGSARASAATRAPAGGSCPAASYGVHFYAPGRSRTVALTFDDGPGKSTAAILSVLARYRVPATFFNIGENVAVRPSMVRREVRRGYVMGNHSWNHPDLALLPAVEQATQMDRASAEEHHVTGTRPCVFRPPYGAYSATTLRLAQERRMNVWLWSVDTQDWMADGSGAWYWVARIIGLAEREGGALRHPVVLMHNQAAGNPATVRALPVIIQFFRSHGYRFVSL